MTFEHFISFATVAATLSVKLIGYPAQIRKIARSGSVENLSLTHFALSFVSYVLWTMHGLLKDDWVIIAGQGLGIVTSGVLLGLLLHYGRRAKARLKPPEDAGDA